MVPNSEKYNFIDFTHLHYDELIKLAKHNYRFIGYHELVNSENVQFVLWRHDVDLSMHEALNLAKIERENGVTATYFLLPHSEFYNLFEASISEIVREIIALGHHIGLHFDASYYDINSTVELEEWLYFEKNIIEKLFSVPVAAFSFHNPTETYLKYDDMQYVGMINTYAQKLKDEVYYCSDSNGYWRHERIYEILQTVQAKKLQILTHPEWWTEKIMSPKQKVWRSIDKRAEKNKFFYKEALKHFERSIIDW